MQTWVRETLQANEGEPRPAPSKGQGAAGSTTASPKPGDYVYVEELPEAITRVPPHYPDDARRAGIWGTVMVQALVGQDGRVKDTRIVKSIPELDAAAMEAVRQWKFKPALAKGEPVEVWVGVPIKFSLH
jgi:protein TonB